MCDVIKIKPDTSVSHLAGTCLTVLDRFVRQRCQWCGEVLVDVDKANTVSPVGTDEPAEWEANSWVEVDGNSWRAVKNESGKFPPNSCMARYVFHGFSAN